MSARKLSPEVSKALKGLFDSVDVNKDGELDINELAKFFKLIGQDSSLDELQFYFSQLDADHSGKLSFDEVVKMMGIGSTGRGASAGSANEKAIKAMFQAFDVDKNGSLSTQEVRQALKVWGENPSEAEFKNRFDALDTDKNGSISYEEFKVLFNKK